MGCCLVKPVQLGSSEEGFGTVLGSKVPYAINAVQGRRPYMEDAVLLWSGTGEQVLGDAMMVAVFDGHGGPQVAQFCEKHFPEILQRQLQDGEGKGPCGELENEVIEGALNDSFFELDDKIEGMPAVLVEPAQLMCCMKVGPPYYRDAENIGTTATTALICSNRIVCANAGDSRTILVRNGQVVFETHDHTPEDTVERERIEHAGGFVEGNRVDGILGVARALGDHRFKTAEVPPEMQSVTAKPDITCIERSGKDQFLILASDGIWAVMSSEEVCAFVKQHVLDANMSLGECAKELLDFCCNKLWTSDNCSVIIVDLRGQPVVDASGSENKHSSTSTLTKSE